MRKQTLQIAVIGAGIGGLTAAACLRRIGFDVRIYEQARGFTRLGAGIQQAPNSIRVLYALGLKDQLLGRAFQPEANEFRDYDTGALTNALPLGETIRKRHGVPYFLMHRGDLHAMLADLIPPGITRLNHKLEGIDEQSDGSVRLRFANGETATADAVVAADGVHSVVREAMLGAEMPRYTGRVAYRTVFPTRLLNGLDVHACVKWWGPDRHIVSYFVNPRRDELYFVTSTPEPDYAVESWSSKGDLATLRAAYDTFHPQVRAILAACPDVHKWALVERDPLPRWVEGNVALLGDACHPDDALHGARRVNRGRGRGDTVSLPRRGRPGRRAGGPAALRGHAQAAHLTHPNDLSAERLAQATARRGLGLRLRRLDRPAGGCRSVTKGERPMDAGYLGVGNMGQPMAGKLMDGGHTLTIFDINEAAMQPLLERQARRAASPKELADTCEIVFVSLPTLAAFRAVAFGPEGLVHGGKMKLLVNTCTVGVPFVNEIVQGMAAKGVTVVDCPISGGPPGARAGTLSVMVSGDPAAVDRVRPMISLWGRTLTVAGDKPGAAQVLKLTNNILSAVALAATAEAFVMGAKGGLDPEVMVSAISAGSGRNSAVESKIPAVGPDPQLRLRRRDAHSDEGHRPGDCAGRGSRRADVGVPSGPACVQARHVPGRGAGGPDSDREIRRAQRRVRNAQDPLGSQSRRSAGLLTFPRSPWSRCAQPCIGWPD